MGGGETVDPGAFENATLEGIDDDNNGVRDDIQRAILARMPESGPQQDSLSQGSKALQAAMRSAAVGDGGMQAAAARQTVRAVDCLHLQFDDALTEIGFLESKAVNTSTRSRAYVDFNKSADGQFFGKGDNASPCD